MKILLHSQAKKILKVLSSDGKEVKVQSSDCSTVFWEVAEKFPDELIAWCEKKYFQDLDLQNWNEVFHHDLIMASYGIDNNFLPQSIGYIDQMPYANVKRNVLYGTWQMSSDVGGIKGEILLRFKPLMRSVKEFPYLLNSIAKIGQQNSLFCYSAPALVKKYGSSGFKSSATNEQLFSFVFQHYKKVWTVLLFWFLVKYEKQRPIGALLKSFWNETLFQKKVDLSGFEVKSSKKMQLSNSIDVIIPTMGRQKFLLDLLRDLSSQTLLPSKIVIIEQNADKNSSSELSSLFEEKWPFEIIHHFIHQTGACNARNIALTEVQGDWIFFADDDIRIKHDLLEKGLKEIQRLGVSALTLNSRQRGERTVFKSIKQWGSFGSGTSIVEAHYAKKCRFLEAYEHGYGEDKDYGMQLRKVGCDIIYHPDLQTLHIKAPVGGFREKVTLGWEKDSILPKPSPLLMFFALKHFSVQQIRGYKTSLFLRFYNKQAIKNPFLYNREMQKRWKRSELWAKKLLQANKTTSIKSCE